MAHSLLIIDDDPATRFAFSRYLTRTGFEVEESDSIVAARAKLRSKRYSVILLDLGLPDGDGLDYLVEIRDGDPAVALVVITGREEVALAVEAMRRGADHFLPKPVSLPDLEVFLLKCLEIGTLRKRQNAQNRLARCVRPFLGESPASVALEESVEVATRSDSPVLLRGETGTGKGVIARWIHEQSSRRNGAFVEINCSALRGEMLASELFGHAKGAFTSAVTTRQGLLEVADGGTLFLDEIGDMELGVQAQFLKVLEERRFRRLGENTERQSDFRLIAATNRELEGDIDRGNFRRDIYYRLQVLPIWVPPLRERVSDLPSLVETLLSQMGSSASIAEPTLDLLADYSWPGNIRELRNLLERAALLAKEKPLAPEHFPGLVGVPASAGPRRTPSFRTPRPDRDQATIHRALAEAEGRVEEAAARLGISRATLYRRLKSFGTA